MKTQNQIQIAHDKLISAILKDPDLGFTKHQREVMTFACKALCWVLEDNDDHTEQLESILKRIDVHAQVRGLKLHCPSQN